MSSDPEPRTDDRGSAPAMAGRLRQPDVVLGVAIMAVAAIGLVDYATGPLWSMSAFYLIPGAWVTAIAGRKTGYALAALSGVSGAVSDVILQPRYGHRAVAAWNARQESVRENSPVITLAV